jgi:hypothetical protein
MGDKMLRNLTVEIWGTVGGDPTKMTVKSSGDDGRVTLTCQPVVQHGGEISVKAEDLIELARMLQSLAPKRTG